MSVGILVKVNCGEGNLHFAEDLQSPSCHDGVGDRGICVRRRGNFNGGRIVDPLGGRGFGHSRSI